MSNILTDLNPNQQEAVQFSGGPLLILAGAGSGKTKVLTHRAAWLIQDGASADNILMLTFTNKAAGEMKERIRKLLTPTRATLPLASTFHSFCARILRIDGKHIGLPHEFVIYDEDDQEDAIKNAIAKLGMVELIKPRAALAVISQAKNELVGPGEYEDAAFGDWQKRIAIIYRSYQKLLLENGAVDFDDLLLCIINLFEKSPETLAKYQNIYRYILVDEWQDTNRAQYQIIKLMAGKHKNLTVVGDASQSIYRWRGADHRNLTYLANDFQGIKVIHLEQNYRSTQKILDAAYHVISKNSTHPILKLWTENGGGDPIVLYQAMNEIDEASFVINEINSLLTYSSTNPLTSKDLAILYRTNAQSRVIEEACLHAGIPYILVGGVRFYARKEIKDVISYLRLLSNQKDTIARARAEKLGKTRFQRFQDLSRQLDTKTHTTLGLLDNVLDKTKYLNLYDPEDPEDANRLENIKELRSVATEFPDLTQFLEQVALVEAAQNEKGISQLNSHSPQPRDSVTLMTAHAAKGLEFPVVFITGLEEGLFPHSRSMDDKEELEEERRLCYVGMTRAKKKLYLTFCAKRMLFGQRMQNIPSRFLADIPSSLLQTDTVLNKPSWLDK